MVWHLTRMRVRFGEVVEALLAKTPEDYDGGTDATRLGGVAEWPIAPVLKTGVVARRPRVRIPPPPLSRFFAPLTYDFL
jgi:hypothetical protein